MEIDAPLRARSSTAAQETVPRPAATVILLRGGADSLEVLLVQRNPQSRFMGGAWVFPGGAVDRSEGEGQTALRAAAVREVAEEAGIAIAEPDSLVPFSRWITPAAGEDPLRHVVLPRAAAGRRDARRRRRARSSTRGGTGHRTPSTRIATAICSWCSRRSSTSSSYLAVRRPPTPCIAARPRARRAAPCSPAWSLSGETARILLPGEPGYDD